jgi:Zn-dependent protease with chaperone function
MHQTTVRFTVELWRSLESEADRLGVSVAQYVRDAALARLSYDRGRKDEHDAGPEPSPGEPNATEALERAESEVTESSALWAQSRLARRRAGDLRERALATRADLDRNKT